MSLSGAHYFPMLCNVHPVPLVGHHVALSCAPLFLSVIVHTGSVVVHTVSLKCARCALLWVLACRIFWCHPVSLIAWGQHVSSVGATLPSLLVPPFLILVVPACLPRLVPACLPLPVPACLPLLVLACLPYWCQPVYPLLVPAFLPLLVSD